MWQRHVVQTGCHRAHSQPPGLQGFVADFRQPVDHVNGNTRTRRAVSYATSTGTLTTELSSLQPSTSGQGDSDSLRKRGWRQHGLHTSHARHLHLTCRALPIGLDADIEDAHLTRTGAGLQVHMVQWYPGHIARAERQLKEQLKMVDVVLEVRDARIPAATWHPQLASWLGNKPSLLVLNRMDMVTAADRKAWTTHLKREGQDRVFWTSGKDGAGVRPLNEALAAMSKDVNARRERRALKPRPVRASVIGFPNIGKSALINRLLNRYVVESAPKPGVTRMLRWVRLGGEVDLLDAPGIIPVSFTDQAAAVNLAICNDIGEAAYVDSLVAATLVEQIRRLPGASFALRKMRERYGIDPGAGTGEDVVVAVADAKCIGQLERAGGMILQDFRTGMLGAMALEGPQDLVARIARARQS